MIHYFVNLHSRRFASRPIVKAFQSIGTNEMALKYILTIHNGCFFCVLAVMLQYSLVKIKNMYGSNLFGNLMKMK